MDSRLFYAVSQHALRSVAWNQHGENEYVLVGDGLTIDRAELQSLADQSFSCSVLWCALSRRETLEVPLSEAADFLAACLPANGVVTVSDQDAQLFLQVHSIGMARTGRSQANNSFKPKPLRGSA